MAEIKAGVNDTYFAWSGSTTHKPGKNGSAAACCLKALVCLGSSDTVPQKQNLTSRRSRVTRLRFEDSFSTYTTAWLDIAETWKLDRMCG